MKDFSKAEKLMTEKEKKWFRGSFTNSAQKVLAMVFLNHRKGKKDQKEEPKPTKKK